MDIFLLECLCFAACLFIFYLHRIYIKNISLFVRSFVRLFVAHLNIQTDVYCLAWYIVCYRFWQWWSFWIKQKKKLNIRMNEFGEKYHICLKLRKKEIKTMSNNDIKSTLMLWFSYRMNLWSGSCKRKKNAYELCVRKRKTEAKCFFSALPMEWLV